VPKRNRLFWLEKFEANRERDARALRALRRSGFRTVVIWECELDDVDAVARRLSGVVAMHRHDSGETQRHQRR
jgi:DNA mismatch endonuclease (patch repair protein)